VHAGIRRWSVLAVLLASVGTACAGNNPDIRAGATDTSPRPPSSSTVPEVLEFEAPLLDGGTFDGRSLAGKDVAFWFWAPW
jgi:hypothetical protein